MELAYETKLREYLLGLTEGDSEHQIEDGILSGMILTDQIRLIEDELIDDYLFGAMSPQEREAFTAHFLSSEDRWQRFVFAKRFLRYARKHQVIAQVTGSTTRQARSSIPQFLWRWVAISAIATSVLLAALWSIEINRFNHATRAASSAVDEVNRLWSQSHLSGEKSTQETASDLTNHVLLLDLGPGPTRGVQSMPVLHESPQGRFIWLRLHLKIAPVGPYREELISDTGVTFWVQEVKVSNHDSPATCEVVIPASLVSPGDYLIRLKETSAGGEELASYPFRVERD